MKLFELRASWEEYYDCPDNGRTKICDVHEAVAFSIDDDTKLRNIAAELKAGHNGEYWSLPREKQLRKLYPGYVNCRDTRYDIVDVSNRII